MVNFESKRKFIVFTIVALAVFAALFYFWPRAPPVPKEQPNISQELPKVNPGIAQPLVPGQCPTAQCRAWIFGSCARKELYKERECFRYGAFPDCPQEVYYDSHTEPVEACSESDCPAGKTFYNYTCI